MVIAGATTIVHNGGKWFARVFGLREFGSVGIGRTAYIVIKEANRVQIERAKLTG